MQLFCHIVIFVCLFWGFRPNQEFFTHLETLLPVKGYTFGPVLGIHGHRAVSILKHTTPTVTGPTL